MNPLTTFVVTAAMLGSAMIGGIFFAFSSFVMKSLARIPSLEGIAAMQSINVVVINPSFLGAFMGTAVLSLGVVGVALVDLSHPSTMFFLGGSIFFLLGTFVVTLRGNVPLNDQLAALSSSDHSADAVWHLYLQRWTAWNHVRTAAAMFAALLFSLGLTLTGTA
jgi:uncharacterized membrane protein